MTVTEPSGGTVGAPVPITIETALAKVFDHSYERFWRPEMVGERREREVNLVLQLGEFVPGSRVLDLACAFGRLTNALTAKGLHVTGVDISEPLLTIARRDAAAMGIRPTYSWRDMRDLSGLGEYDGVVLWLPRSATSLRPTTAGC